jgi:hypothetical protein
MSRIAAAASFIGNAHLMVFKVFLNIVIKGIGLGWHGKGFTTKKVGGTVNFPT